MTRSRSPQYPSLSLPQAIDMASKLHKANRTSVITRETAAKDMGYTGLTGRSLTVLAALAQYGLIEKAGKGDVKVSRRAVEILHPLSDADRAEAIQDAACAPSLFQQLQERYPEGIPSQNALRSYLVQQDFGDVAIGPAISAFLETIAFAENANESGRNSSVDDERANTPAMQPPETTMQQTPSPPAQPPSSPPGARHTLISNRKLDHNEVYLDFRGSQEVHVEGILDLNGILDLEEKLKAVKMLLKAPLTQPAGDDGDDASAEVSH